MKAQVKTMGVSDVGKSSGVHSITHAMSKPLGRGNDLTVRTCSKASAWIWCGVLCAQEMMCGEEPLPSVLRLLCLLSLTAGGMPKKFHDALRREVLASYGHEHLPTLSKLQDAGALLHACVSLCLGLSSLATQQPFSLCSSSWGRRAPAAHYACKSKVCGAMLRLARRGICRCIFI